MATTTNVAHYDMAGQTRVAVGVLFLSCEPAGGMEYGAFRARFTSQLRLTYAIQALRGGLLFTKTAKWFRSYYEYANISRGL